MSFVSFARQFEDVLLWRALRDVAGGFYIQIGVPQPDGFSLTRTFDERGWSGVSLGLKGAGQLGALGSGPVHFLAVDAAAETAATLHRMDFRACRPWVIVVQAAGPAAWEPALLDAGYRLVRADGASRFYVAAEQHGALAAAFAEPPNAADGFVPGNAAVAADAGQALAIAQAEAALAAVRAQSASQRLLDATRATGAARTIAAERAATVGWLRDLLDQATQLERRLRAEVIWLREQVDERTTQLIARREDSAAFAALVDRLQAIEARDALARAVGQAILSLRLRRALRLMRGAPLPVSPPHGAAALPTPEPDEPAGAEEATAAPAPALAIAAPDAPAPPPRPGAPVHAVHQFHSGSAVGDAITNAMIMLRGALRAMGFDSEIFVEHRDPALAHELGTIAQLPRHGGYVLLAHHSMGYPSFDRIIALPAQKVLVYHNITPPEFLGHIPEEQERARLGREQLALWREHAAAALADSDYNMIELRRMGFDAARTCTLLFDTAVLERRAAAARAPRDPGVFTILFVGRFTPSKAQDDLITAYALFCAQTAMPTRLVLLGAFDPDQSAYLDTLERLVLDFALTERVLMTGLASDGELHAWYGRADLYVSLSHHEGFGVPLVEAMAHGVPVLAWPAGAVPYTLGGAAALLHARDPAAVAGRILDLSRDPAARAAIVRQQAAALTRFDLARHLPVLRDAVALAGAQPRPSAATQADLAATMRFAIAGHVNGTYSLAAVNRAVAAAIESVRPGAVRLVPVEGEPTTALSQVPPEDAALTATLAARRGVLTAPEVVISQHYPVYVPAERGDLTLALVFWEESVLPAATVRVLNAHFDGVLSPSSFVARALVESGVAVPVANVGLAPPLGAYAALADRSAGAPFTFLHVSSAFPRKGVDVLLAAWRRAFRAGDPVRLVIKTFANPHNDTGAQVERLRFADPEAAPIRLVDADIGAAEHLALFAAADAMVLPARGEGYNLVAAEAMAAGLPLIVTDCGGHLDFCGPGTARLVRSHSAPARTHLSAPHSLWAEPDEDDLVEALRAAVNGPPAGQVAAARTAIAAHTDPAAFVDRLADVAARLILATRAAARIAWVSSWDVRCGIAGYSRALLDAMPRDGVAQLTVLCDDRTPDGPDVRACWSLDERTGVADLLDAVASEDADVVMIQYHPGLITWERFTLLLTGLAEGGRAAVATLHNTAHLLSLKPEVVAAAAAALAGCARVLVHTLADIERLAPLGVRPVLLPHGAPAARQPRPARDLPPDAAPVVGCYGFFLPHKGIGALIQAVASLRERWPGIRLRLVNAEYAPEHSAAEVAACRALAAKLDLAVEWHLDYLPDAESGDLLADCDLIALPYEPSVEASSAALRTALASGVPVAVTPIALFDEAEDAAARLPGGSPAALAEGIAGLLENPGLRTALSEAAGRWLAIRTVPAVAVRVQGLLRGVAAQRRLGLPVDGTIVQPAVRQQP